ncbi:MAG: hypothetical protein ABIN36_19685 [Ferruginibacter sp.]
MRYFGLLMMLIGLVTLVLGEIVIVTEERLANVDVEKSEPILWTVYVGIVAMIGGLLFAVSGKKRSFSREKRNLFNDPMLNI